MFHAVIYLDHHHAQVLHFDAHQVHAACIEPHHPRAHGHDLRVEHALFAAICQALQDTREVLVTGSHPVIGEFRHYVEAREPALASRIADYRPAAELSQGQMLALARQFFVAFDRMAGVPTPS
ncbi:MULTISPECIES: hypothetical protein [unclassified Roseateles]|uniref:hypothetical protein n=1 Tax=unclassified Roseateles TaxID=2626991 RepID=UPI000700673D|nr:MULTISPECIES: hypothetical protein [unclassified Roseateles]KQW45562.1 hypothetical protein ASC81_11715 [Pelomonas sp. Root405]KRA72406.1 hypothetical protein ASD88_11715 [Pelomonas sp. Root662]